ncbi:SDR family NAD(P)-dependent oxidoreductase [bacterium]|nr:MAG: SDR family NAD(P)-dependent oxidoreductase [bacterium]
MKKRVLLITGASKGIGLSLAKSALESGFDVYNFSRTEGDFTHPNLHFIPIDLVDTISAVAKVDSVLKSLQLKDYDTIGLINNAGVLEPMYPMGKTSKPELIEEHFSVNTISPIALSELFIHELNRIDTYKFILNVGSGAADYPYEGWANYGASKAALHYFTKTVALEQKKVSNPVILALFNPGRTNTQMQTQIRSASQEDFPFTESFIQAYEQGKLNSPDVMAEELIKKINNKTILQGDEISHKDLLS